jgi:hypothetical protein
MSAVAPLIRRDPAKVITCKCVLSYPHLFKPRAMNPGDVPLYGAVFIFTIATDRPCLEQIKSATDFVGSERWRDYPLMVEQKRLRLPWRRGEERADQKGYGPGKIFIGCRAESPPGVVDRNVQPILDPREIYAGCYVIASIRAFAYDRNGNKGISFGLNNVQKVGEGERLDARSTPSQDFTPLGDDPAFGDGGSTDDMFQ